MTLVAIRFLVTVFLAGVALFALLDPRGRRRVRDFFIAEGHPINLAIFRIIFFYVLGRSSTPFRDNAAWFATVPPEFRVAPPGWRWLIELVPFDARVILVAGTLCYLFSILAMIGLWSRTSAWIAVVLAFYVAGVPQFFGKLIHYHHLIWFGVILAASRCGDTLSVDALLARLRSRGAKPPLPPRPAVAYALPLRFCWLMIGVIYFFPGLWKAWNVADQWVLGDYLKFHLHHKWLEVAPFLPEFRLDRYPLLYRSSGLATILFEISFIFLLFFPQIRLVAVAGGLFFHFNTLVFMKISFSSLVRCYPVFVNSHYIFQRLRGLLERFGLPPSRAVSAYAPAPSSRPVAIVGGVLLLANVVCGFTGIDSWPVAIYPRFDYHLGPRTTSLEVNVETADGQVRSLDEQLLSGRMQSARLSRLKSRVAHSQNPRMQLVFLQLLARNGLVLEAGDRIRFYQVQLETEPEKRSQNPIGRRLIREIVLSAEPPTEVGPSPVPFR